MAATNRVEPLAGGKRTLMRLLLIVGCVLVLLGVTGMVWGGFTYTRDRKTSLGPIDITYEDKERIPIHPAVGAVVLAAGVVVFAAGLKRR